MKIFFCFRWSMVTFPWDDSPACTDDANAVCSEDNIFYDLALNYAYNHAFMYKGYGKIYFINETFKYNLISISQCPCHPDPFSIGNYRSEDLEIVSGGLQVG